MYYHSCQFFSHFLWSLIPSHDRRIVYEKMFVSVLSDEALELTLLQVLRGACGVSGEHRHPGRPDPGLMLMMTTMILRH
jgi:hypothetical protein